MINYPFIPRRSGNTGLYYREWIGALLWMGLGIGLGWDGYGMGMGWDGMELGALGG